MEEITSSENKILASALKSAKYGNGHTITEAQADGILTELHKMGYNIVKS